MAPGANLTLASQGKTRVEFKLEQFAGDAMVTSSAGMEYPPNRPEADDFYRSS